MEQMINALEAYAKIRNSKEQMFIVFRKREDGKLCTMNAFRTASRRGKYKAESKLCVAVWDLDENAYRDIPLDGLRILRIGNSRFVVEGFQSL